MSCWHPCVCFVPAAAVNIANAFQVFQASLILLMSLLLAVSLLLQSPALATSLLLKVPWCCRRTLCFCWALAAVGVPGVQLLLVSSAVDCYPSVCYFFCDPPLAGVPTVDIFPAVVGISAVAVVIAADGVPAVGYIQYCTPHKSESPSQTQNKQIT